MEEENNWQVSNKKTGGKRFLRQFIVFLIAIIIIAIAVLVFIVSNKNKEELENTESNTTQTENEVEDVEIQKASIEEKVYSIEDKDFYFENEEEDEDSGIKLYEYDNTNSKYAKIYYVLNSYTTDPSYNYIIEATSESGESLLLNDRDNKISERDVVGGVVSFIKIDKERLGSKINITVKEMIEHSSSTKTLARKGSVTLDITKDLEEQEKIDLKNSTAKYELGDIEFQTYKGDTVDRTVSQSSSPTCNKETYMISMATQYGNRTVNESYILFYRVKNVNELSLDDAFEIETKIEETIGTYGLQDIYTVYASNGSGEITNEYTITFEDMKKLIEGEDVSSGGKKISAKDISDGEGNLKVKSNSKTTINGISAIKYDYKTEEDTVHYMFIVNEYIYYISVPTGEKFEENVEVFLDSLSKK